MKSLITWSLLLISVFSQNNCDYGRFEAVDDYGSDIFESTLSYSCMFDCEYDNNYIEIEDLPFDTIKSACSNVERVANAYPDDCNSLDDLVFPSDYGYCSCPYCKCSKKNEEGEILTMVSYGPQKECESCTCSASATNYGIDEMVYNCDQLMEVDDPREWNDFQCPPESCTATSYSGSTNELDGGDYWWNDVGDSDIFCTEFCYCSGKDGEVCETGYTNIMANDGLFNKFMYSCGDYNNAAACYDIDKQTYDASRLFTTDAGPSCSHSCPKCDCDGRDAGDKWYIEYQYYWDVNQNVARCSECECKTDFYGSNYADCEYGDYYIIGTRSCPAEVYSCHEDYNSDSASVGTLSTDECSGYGDSFTSSYNYCEWYTYQDDYDSGIQYSWDCSSGVVCEAFSDNKCTYIDVELTGTNCDGETETENIKQYTYCCRTSDNCNHVDIDISSCTRSTDFEDLYKGYWDCVYDYDSDAGELLCDDSVDEITCNGLLTVYRQQSKCICNVYGDLYDKVSSGTKTLLQQEINSVMEQYSEWNDVFGCNINLECDLAKGGVLTNNSAVSGLLYIIGLMWTLLVSLHIVW